MMLVCTACSQGDHDDCAHGRCQCEHLHDDGTYIDRCIEQWRVTDARGETSSISSDIDIARKVASCLDGSKIWYRQIRTVRTRWRVVEEVHLDGPVVDVTHPSTVDADHG